MRPRRIGGRRLESPGRARDKQRAVTQNSEAVLNIGRSPYTDPS
jgi:hypothetical protein